MIDKELQAQLRAKYNPDGSALRKSQLIMLDILKSVDRICTKYKIEYWLSSGTLLGAVRHGGFIPWDDDLDIEILYSDKKRFIEACQKELPDNFVVQCHETDNSYCVNILKIRDRNSRLTELRTWNGNEYEVNYKYNGYFIDIFTEEYSTKFLLKLSRIPIRVISIAQYKWKMSSFMLDFIYKMNEMIYFVLRLISKFVSNRKYLYHSYGSWFISRRLKTDIFPTKKILFEGDYFSVPNNTHSYLERVYGDYLELPKEVNRHPSHAVSK